MKNRIEALRCRWAARAANDPIANRQLGWLAGYLCRDNVDEVNVGNVDLTLAYWAHYCVTHPMSRYYPWYYSFLRGYYGR